MDYQSLVSRLAYVEKNYARKIEKPSLVALNKDAGPSISHFNSLQYNDNGDLWVVDTNGKLIKINTGGGGGGTGWLTSGSTSLAGDVVIDGITTPSGIDFTSASRFTSAVYDGVNGTSGLNMTPSQMIIGTKNVDYSVGALMLFYNNGNAQIVLTGDTNTFTYGGDYSANFTDRSLVDKGWVVGNTWGLSGNTLGVDGKQIGALDNHDFTITQNSKRRLYFSTSNNNRVIFGDTIANGTIGQVEIQYDGNVAYGLRGIALHDMQTGAFGVLQMISGSTMYITDAAGTPGGLAVGTLNNSVDGSTFTPSFNAWTFSAGQLNLSAATTGYASLKITSSAGAAPSSPTDGQMWYDGTNVKFRVGGTTKTFTLV